MGVPVVSLVADPSLGRMGASILNAADCAGWVAADADEWVSIEIRLARDPATLQEIRAGLRAKLRASPLLAGQRFAGGFEGA